MQRKQDELFDACQNMRSADTKRLLQEGVDPNTVDKSSGNTPLFYAVTKGDFDSVDHLCAAGANVNFKNRLKQTPLIYLFHHNPGQALYLYQLLLAKGANPYFEDQSGSSLFDLAYRSHQDPILDTLKEWEQDNWKTVNELKKKAAEPDSEPAGKSSSKTPGLQEVLDVPLTDQANDILRHLRTEYKQSPKSIEHITVDLIKDALKDAPIIAYSLNDNFDNPLKDMILLKTISLAQLIHMGKENPAAIKVYRKYNNLQNAIDIHTLMQLSEQQIYFASKEETTKKIKEYVQNEIKKKYSKEEKSQPAEPKKIPDNSAIPTSPQPSQYASATAAKPFIASPIHTTPSSTKSAEGNITIAYGPIQIIFEIKSGTSDWRLEVLHAEKPAKRRYLIVYDGKRETKEISQIQSYLVENNISGLIAFIEGHGESARSIAHYLRGEIKISDSNKPKK